MEPLPIVRFCIPEAANPTSVYPIGAGTCFARHAKDQKPAMFRKLFTLFVVLPLGILLVVFAVANRHPVIMSLDPFGSGSPSLTATVPLFLLVLGTLVVGVIVGGVATWFGQARWRRAASRFEAEARALRRERDGLKRQLAEKELADAREAAAAQDAALAEAPVRNAPALPAPRIPARLQTV